MGLNKKSIFIVFILFLAIFSSSCQFARSLPEEEKSKITGYMHHFADILGNVIIDIYNGSNWTITEITIRIVTKDPYSNNTIWDRKYKRDKLKILPLSSNSFEVYIGFDKRKVKVEWYIEDVKGYKSL